MGSLIARTLIKRYDDDYDKVILSGSPSNRIGKRGGLFLADIMGLVGENGAGKSTTIKLILDIIKRDTGSIKIFGEEVVVDCWLCCHYSYCHRYVI